MFSTIGILFETNINCIKYDNLNNSMMQSNVLGMLWWIVFVYNLCALFLYFVWKKFVQLKLTCRKQMQHCYVNIVKSVHECT